MVNVKQNLTGEQFGKLKVVEQAEDYITAKGTHVARWLCECDCGNKTVVDGSKLKSGHTKSCGCLMKKKEDLVGKIFNRLTVIEQSKTNTKKWLCKCECGNFCEVYTSNLKRGLTQSCGCLHKEIASKTLLHDLSGQKFGRLTVIKRDNEYSSNKEDKSTYWLCKCDCGSIKTVRAECLKSGSTKSCGCLKGELSSQRFSLNLVGKKYGKLTVIQRNGTFVGANGTQYSQWLCKCDCGTMKTIRGHDLVRGTVTSCGCTISRGEEEIRKILNSKNIKYNTQYGFSDLKSEKGWMLRFDFAILNSDNKLIALIEYQGIQHYIEQPCDFGKQQREITDPMKKEYCREKGIPLFEINYQDNIEEKILQIIKCLNLDINN